MIYVTRYTKEQIFSINTKKYSEIEWRKTRGGDPERDGEEGEGGGEGEGLVLENSRSWIG